MVDTYNQLKAQGYQFPVPHKPDLVKTQAMLDKEKEEEELQLALALSLSAQEATKSKSSASKPASRPAVAGPKVLFQVRALYDFPGMEEGELRLSRGELINVYDATTFQDWWKGESKGRIGIFPSNYVEKVEGGPSGAGKTWGGFDAARASGGNAEAQVLAESDRIGEFVRLLSTIDPKRDNLSENEPLQESYHAILVLRPKLVKIVEQHKRKQDELIALNDRFTKACSTYHKLMEASLAQYQHSAYAPQQTAYPQQGYATPPPSQYGNAPAGHYAAHPQQQQQYAPAPGGDQGYYGSPPQNQGYVSQQGPPQPTSNHMAQYPGY
ncbi:ESCRT-0 subunit protein hse1 [Borealophlyctis nickersoniae]|nr:ESCRT-0 subunit protein hse1 [Borealophlyctis nickersoniae]